MLYDDLFVIRNGGQISRRVPALQLAGIKRKLIYLWLRDRNPERCHVTVEEL